ncbi:MAG: hypothetical protein Q4D38_11480 [Planctomycetia bacterium]|nr:hypothetical protein [Planctomycetia bacterium]
MWEYTVVGVIVAAAFLYTTWTLWKSASGPHCKCSTGECPYANSKKCDKERCADQSSENEGE